MESTGGRGLLQFVFSGVFLPEKPDCNTGTGAQRKYDRAVALGTLWRSCILRGSRAGTRDTEPATGVASKVCFHNVLPSGCMDGN